MKIKVAVGGLIAVGLLVFAGGLLGSSGAVRVASHRTAPVVRHDGLGVERSASLRVKPPHRPPRLQLVSPLRLAACAAEPRCGSTLAPGRWAVAYTYFDSQNDESPPSPRYILTVRAGMDLRILPAAAPASVDHLAYYVSPAVNVVTDLRRYSFGDVADLIVTGPGTGPVAPTLVRTQSAAP
jgi:hypothetical protein